MHASAQRTHLRIELDVGCAEANEAREQGLVQVAVLLDRHVLHHRRELVVVANQDDALQPVMPVLLALQPACRQAAARQNNRQATCVPGNAWKERAAADLQQHWDERLDLQDLGTLLHEQVVILEAQLQELPAPGDQCSAAAREHAKHALRPPRPCILACA